MNKTIISKLSGKKTLALLWGAAVLASLTACGGSDAPPGRTAQAWFSNMATVAATRVVVENEAGKTLYASAIDCTQAEQCQLTMADYVPPSRLRFKFYDKDGKFVSASDILSTDRDHFTLPHADVMLGAYLFKNFARQNELNPHELSARLDTLFDKVESPDGQPDQFEELGMLYTKVRVEQGYDEAQFYRELKTRLDSHYVLPPSHFQSTNVNASPAAVQAIATATFGNCPWWASGLGKAADMFGKYIPYVGETVGSAIGKGLAGAVDAGCDESSNTLDQVTKANEKLDAMQVQLDQMDAKIDALGYDLRDLNNAVYDVMNLTAQINYRRALSDIRTSTNVYRNLLGSQYQSLTDFAQKKGGLAKMGQDTTLVKLLTDIGKQNQAFQTLADDATLGAMGAVLANKCADASKIRGDVIAQRGECNLVLARLTAEYMQAQTSMALLMKDEIAMVNAAIKASSKPQTITDRYTSPFGANWDKAQDEVNATLKTQLATFNEKLGAGYIDVTQGLPSGVAYGVGFSAGCHDGKGILMVSEWYPNVDVPYLVTHCYNGGRYVKSRYFYDDAHDKVVSNNHVNVLGVVVNKARTDITDRSTPWMQAGARGYAQSTPSDPQERGLTVKLDPNFFTISNADYPPAWVMEPGAGNQFAENCSPIQFYCGTLPEKYRYALKQVVMPTDGFNYFTSRIFETSWNISNDNRGSVTGKTDLFATIAYTPQSKLGKADPDNSMTVVWQVQVAYGGDGNGGYYNNWRLRCITADCSVDGNKLRFEGNAKVKAVSLDGAYGQWKTFTIQ